MPGDLPDDRIPRLLTQAFAQVGEKGRGRHQDQLVEVPLEARVLHVQRHLHGKAARLLLPGRERPVRGPSLAAAGPAAVAARRCSEFTQLAELAQPRHTPRHGIDGRTLPVCHHHPGSLHGQRFPRVKHLRLQPAPSETTIIGPRIDRGDLGQ